MSVAKLLNSPWALQESSFVTMCEIYDRHAKGEPIDILKIETALGRQLNNEPKPYEVVKGVAVMDLSGPLAKRMNMFSRISGGTSTELFAGDFQKAIHDSSVKSILIDVDSPGGAVDGTQAAAKVVLAGRKIKPVFAIANDLMASGAYWIGSAAGKVFASADTATVGSIGVVTRHTDMTEYEKKIGAKTTILTAGKYKAMGNSFEPLNKESADYIQSQLDHIYSVFIDAVAQNRGVSSERVAADMAEGRIFIGQQAVDAGLIDGVKSFEEVLDLAANANRVAVQVPKVSFNNAEEKRMNEEQIKELEAKVRAEEQAKSQASIADARREGYAAGLTDGATKELERIQGVFGASLPGHEDAINAMAFDGKTTPAQAAAAVISAERSKLSNIRSNMRADTAKNDLVPAGAGNTNHVDTKNLPVDQAAKIEWDRDATIRSQFNGSFEGYLLFKKAEARGGLKVSGGGR